MKRTLSKQMLTVMLTGTANSSVKQQIPFNVWQKTYNRFLNQVCRLTSGECSATILREIDRLGIEHRAHQNNNTQRHRTNYPMPFAYNVANVNATPGKIRLYRPLRRHPRDTCVGSYLPTSALRIPEYTGPTSHNRNSYTHIPPGKPAAPSTIPLSTFRRHAALREEPVSPPPQDQHRPP